MKLCPQCDFIYEDDQTVCDMDGKELVFEPTLTAFPATTPFNQSVPLPRTRSPRYRRMAVAAMAGLALGVTLVLFFYLFTQGVSSAEPAGAPTSSSNPILPLPEKSASTSALPTPVVYGATPLAADPGNADFQLEKDGSTSGIEQQPLQHAIASADARVTARTGARATATEAGAATATPTLSISSLPPVQPLPQLKPLPKLGAPKVTKKTQMASSKQMHASLQRKKESRFGSFIKKTTKILKKPFKR